MIDGHKWFSSSAEGAAFGIVMAVTDPDAPPHRRMSQILVPTDTPGYELIRPIPVMGHAGRGWSTHCEVRYTDVRVPLENVLGEPGDGFRIAQKRLGPGRIHHVMRWLGQMQRAFELMCAYSLERHVGGVPLAEKQTVQNWIADSAAEIQACRLLTLDAARKLDEGDEARVEVSLIKFYAARVLNEVIDRAIQVHGARGLTDETPLGGMYEQARARPDLRRPGRGAPDGRQPPDPEGVPGRRHVHVRLRRALTSTAPPGPGPRHARLTGGRGSISRARSRSPRQLFRLEAVRPGLSLEGDPPVAADQVEPVGPAAVGERDLVVDVVEQDRDACLQAHRARSGRLCSLLERRRIDEGDLLAPVVGEHPAVLRVRLADVDDEERDLVAVAVVKLLQLAQLAAEGRSGVRAEDERHGPHAREIAEADSLAARTVCLGVEERQVEREGGSAGSQGRRHQAQVGGRGHHVLEGQRGVGRRLRARPGLSHLSRRRARGGGSASRRSAR